MKTKQWFEACVPNPNEDNLRVQLGCHAEEFQEMLDAIRFADGEPFRSHHDYGSVPFIAEELKRGGLLVEVLSRRELVDAMADQIVTALGVLHMMGVDSDAVMAEVERSNASKLVDGKPVFNEHGKIMKGPNYTPPNLDMFL